MYLLTLLFYVCVYLRDATGCFVGTLDLQGIYLFASQWTKMFDSDLYISLYFTEITNCFQRLGSWIVLVAMVLAADDQDFVIKSVMRPLFHFNTESSVLNQTHLLYSGVYCSVHCLAWIDFKWMISLKADGCAYKKPPTYVFFFLTC